MAEACNASSGCYNMSRPWHDCNSGYSGVYCRYALGGLYVVSRSKPHILILDDKAARYQAIRLALPDIGVNLKLEQVTDRRTLASYLANGGGDSPVDLILCAPDVKGLPIPDVKAMLSECGTKIPLVAFADLVESDAIVSLISHGADDVADFQKSDHLTLVTAHHIGAMDTLRERWRRRDNSAEAGNETGPALPPSSSASGEPAGDAPAADSAATAAWRHRIMEAVRDQHFSLSRQRISSLDAEDDGQREHIDILLRLQLPEGDGEQRVAPGKFLDQARNAGLAAVIDGWVVHQVCSQLGNLNAQGHHPLFFVRLMPETLQRARVAQFVKKFIDQHACEANGLAFEVPASLLPALGKAEQRQLHGLRELGCLITYSHCGTDNPFTDWPEGLAPDYIKLDAGELNQIMEDPQAVEKLQSVVQQMHAHNVQVIAPQVEHANSLAVIWSSGVDYAQGYYQSHPEVVLSSIR